MKRGEIKAVSPGRMGACIGCIGCMGCIGLIGINGLAGTDGSVMDPGCSAGCVPGAAGAMAMAGCVPGRGVGTEPAAMVAACGT